MAENGKDYADPAQGPRPEPRLTALQVDEICGFAPSATAFSYFGALLTLGVLIESGDIGRGAVWFLWATAVTFFRSTCIVAYRRRAVDSDPHAWGRLMVAANFLAAGKQKHDALVKAQDDLREVLTTRQEAICLLGGLLN